MIQSRIVFSFKLKGLLLLLALSILYGYWQHFYADILPIHECRKADSLTQAIQYFKGASFFEPSTNWISSSGNRNAAAEFPLIYFLVGQIWKLTGYHLWIAKIFSIGLLWASMLSILPLLKQLFDSEKKSLVFMAAVYSFPVLSYYSDTLLPNVYSFSFLILALAQFFNYWAKEKGRYFILFTIFLSLAVLLKITALIAVFAFFGAWTTSKLWQKEWLKSLGIKKVQNSYLALAITLVLALIWYRYAINYNAQNGSTIFSTTIRPIWEVSISDVWRIGKLVFLEHSREIFPLFFWPFGLLLIIWVFLSKAVSLIMKHLMVFSLIGVFCYLILWFWVFEVHDYYFIELLFLPALLLAVYLKYEPKWPVFRRSQKTIEFVLLAMIFLNTVSFTQIAAGHQNAIVKNTPFISSFIKGNWSWFYFNHQENLGQLQAQSKNIRKVIAPTDTVLCFSDPYANIHLTTINRIGYTNYSLDQSSSVSSQIQGLIEKGSSKLLVLKQDIAHPEIQCFLKHLRYQKGNVFVYDLRPFGTHKN